MDRSTDDKYKELCTKWGFEEIKKDNIVICGGRQFIAEHFEEQKDFLNLWHKQDPDDDIELARTLSIASYQDDIVNPFVIDSTLVKRIWYFNCYENVTSQALIEHVIRDNNYEATIDINSDSKINIIDLIYMLQGLYQLLHVGLALHLHPILDLLE